MRIGLYGMPTSGKSYIMERIDFMEVVVGSRLLRQFDPDFDKRDEIGREYDRKAIAQIMLSKGEFIMDGHYSFGDEIAFTEEDGKIFDAFLYLYISPEILRERMNSSPKNQKYLKYDLREWQEREIKCLREYCHTHDKDFYIIDNPTFFSSEDIDTVLSFIKELKDGYSCFTFAKKCADEILDKCSSEYVTLLDGDKTLTIEDSSNRSFGYTTHLFDGNFYTGYQTWKQNLEFETYCVKEPTTMPISTNDKVMNKLDVSSFILTSGNAVIWRYISRQVNLPYFCGHQMSAETKYFITKILQRAGRKVIAYGDGMNDYYMLLQADKGYLVCKQDGTVSRSLKGQELGGLELVRT